MKKRKKPVFRGILGILKNKKGADGKPFLKGFFGILSK
jgi:hypothetical protein